MGEQAHEAERMGLKCMEPRGRMEPRAQQLHSLATSETQRWRSHSLAMANPCYERNTGMGEQAHEAERMELKCMGLKRMEMERMEPGAHGVAMHLRMNL